MLKRLENPTFEGDDRQITFNFIKWLGTRKVDEYILTHLQTEALRVKIDLLQTLLEERFPIIEDSFYGTIRKDVNQLLRENKTKEKDELGRSMAELDDPQEREAANERHKKLTKEIAELK